MQNISLQGSPRIIITQVEGNLDVRPREGFGSVDIEDEAGARVQQEGDVLLISGCKGNLALWLPWKREAHIPLATAITVTHLTGDVKIEGAGPVELRDIVGSVQLHRITGDVRLERIDGLVEMVSIDGSVSAAQLRALLVRRGISGAASLSHIPVIEIDSVGRDLSLTDVETAEIIAVGGDMEATAVVAAVRSTTVGGDCSVSVSAQTEVSISNVAGDFHMEGKAHGRMSNIGGDLHLLATYPQGSTTRFHVDENACVTLPANVSLELYVMVGGELSGEALGSGVGANIVRLIYGDGAARLNLHISGDLQVLGAVTPRTVLYG